MWYSHVPGSFEPLALEQGGRAYFYHLDGLGTPLALTDAEGKEAVRYDYAAFGARRRHGGRVRQALVFPGQYLDEETGLHYNWHRYYDPATGRYLTPDPIGVGGGIHLYSYVDNNPINYTDLFGLVTCQEARYQAIGFCILRFENELRECKNLCQNNKKYCETKAEKRFRECLKNAHNICTEDLNGDGKIDKWDDMQWFLFRFLWGLLTPPNSPYPPGYGKEGPGSIDPNSNPDGSIPPTST
ncbi:hypothetical protein G3N55_12280 [Dissulfurirhabdus thermomarina]|uniref:RHS protein conserved region domain-containing protein n=1 Tax=Dissulfurirhabdus thermomarina TaxID=1765737 RepID=A0A6N9TQR0_DISTH|nr:RHS repeat-associated core domain-containing protein [Dissulfurirhabdus thermomarina]NDY43611.1 hypothetical protein [Dissulfurirhabdus thermomarina]